MSDERWEYYVFTRNEESDEDLNEVLESVASANYELVTVRTRADGRVTYYTRRRVRPTT